MTRISNTCVRMTRTLTTANRRKTTSSALIWLSLPPLPTSLRPALRPQPRRESVGAFQRVYRFDESLSLSTQYGNDW